MEDIEEGRGPRRPPLSPPDGPGTSAARSSPAEPRTAPRWFEVTALAGALAVASVGSLGLLLAVLGRYETWLALVLGVPVAAGLTFAVARSLPVASTGRAAHAGAAAAVALALAFLVFAGATPSENLVITRDPGSYVNTGRWLAREGSLEVDARAEAFEGVRGLQFSGAAVYDMGDPFPPPEVTGPPGEVRQSGEVEFQFSHLAPVLLAAGYDVGGHQVLFRVPALLSALSLLLVYATAVRLTGRAFVSLLAPTLLAACLPVLYVARNTYSESATSVLLWAAVLVLAGLHHRPRWGAGVAGGVLLGALVCARIDALLYVGMALPLAALSVATAGPGRLRRDRAVAWLVTGAAATVVGLIGWVDLNERTGHYIRDLTDQISLLRAGVLGAAAMSAVGLAAWLLVPQARRAALRARRPAAIAAAALVLLVLLAGWLVRPHVQTATTNLVLPTVENVQRAQGLPIDPDRSYAEDTLRWMAWYLGAPALLAAIGALAWTTWRTVLGRVDAVTVAVLVLCLGAGGLYWWNPEITPDHLWATRRFVPATFPALALWATVAVGALAGLAPLERLRTRQPAAAVGALTVAALVLVLPPALTTKPVRENRIQEGFHQPVDEACDALGPDAAVIVLGGFGSATLPQTVRSWCGVPAAAQGSAIPTLVEAQGVAAELAANGYELHLLSPDAGGLAAYQEASGPEVVSTHGVDQYRTAEQTLDRAPSRYVDPALAIAAPTPFTLHVLRVDPD